jgi:hypothetical protein
VLDFARFAWPMRPLVRGAMAGLGVREGDYRDWQALDSWLRDTVARLEKAT